MDPYLPIMGGTWAASYRPGNVHGYDGPAFALGIAFFANTGGQDSATGVQPIPPDNAGTTALDVAGVAYDGTPNAQFTKITTALILRNLVEVLRTKPILLQQDAFVRARNVKGTTNFVYTLFGDLGAADNLLEGVPPVTVPLALDTMSFIGTQRGKLVAITDLAEMMSPFELYSQAAEKLAWNAVETAENEAVNLLCNTGPAGVTVSFAAIVGPPAYPVDTTIEQKIVKTVTTLKKAEVPPYEDGLYRGLVSPMDASVIMNSNAAGGWSDVNKYTNSSPILNGEIGTFRGVRWLESNRIPDGKSIVMGRDSIAWGDYQTVQAYRVGPGGNHADPLAQRGLMGWKGMWGMQVIAFSGTPAAGPAGNPLGYRYARVQLV